VHVDCGALAPTLIESELFGHERGAFTGAATLRRGRFETAELGTVFLDEVGELSLQLQAKLLRVLEDRAFERVGGSTPLRLHARVVAATNRNLHACLRAGSFRPDLYYRLNVLAIDVPALHERASDVPLLVESGLRRICELCGVTRPPVSDEVLAELCAQRWPGNVRQLMNLLERLAIEDREALSDPIELAPYLATLAEAARIDLREPSPLVLDAEERADAERTEAALIESGGNVSRTARRLELKRSTLRHRITKYRLGHLVPRD
jgi:DNA-binding NtrC family response regulator